MNQSNCVDSWKKAAGLDPDSTEGMSQEDIMAKAAENAALHMATLEELVEAMQTESPVDFRKVDLSKHGRITE